MKSKLFLSKTSWLAAAAGCLLVSTGVKADLLIEADFNGAGTGTGGTTNIVTYGGTGVLVSSADVVAMITNANPFVPGVTNNYLNIQKLTSTGGGLYNGAVFTSASGTNFLNACQGPSVLGDSGYTDAVFHIAFDTFFRINTNASNAGDELSLRPLDTHFEGSETTNGIRLTLTGTPAPGARAQLGIDALNPAPAGAGALQNLLTPYNSGYSFMSLNSDDTTGWIMNSDYRGDIINGSVYHVAFTIDTDTNTADIGTGNYGLTTENFFLITGTGEIDTNYPLFTATFDIDATQVGNPAWLNVPWAFGQMWGESPNLGNIDYSTTRLYNSVPASFPSLPVNPNSPVVAGWNGSSSVGTTIMGISTSDFITTPYADHGTQFGMDDGNVNTRQDTWNPSTTDPFSYVGFTWTAPVNASNLIFDVTFNIFIDGGWFGQQSNATQPLGSNLIIPTLQVTTNGTDWISLTLGTDFTTDYISQLTGQSVNGLPTAHFTLSSAVTNVVGVRLIGSNGGTSGGGLGFIGVCEESVTRIVTVSPPGFLPPTVSGGQITLSWTNSGTLLWAPTVSGPWTTNSSAVSPYTEPVLPTQNRFYRLKQ